MAWIDEKAQREGIDVGDNNKGELTKHESPVLSFAEVTLPAVDRLSGYAVGALDEARKSSYGEIALSFAEVMLPVTSRIAQHALDKLVETGDEGGREQGRCTPSVGTPGFYDARRLGFPSVTCSATFK